MQQVLFLPDGELTFHPAFFPPADSDRLLQGLVQDTPWRQDKIRLFGKEIDQPRLTAWYGDPGKSYTYSGLRLEPLPWTPLLLEIKSRVEKEVNVTFNSVLLNLYRHGQDSMGWHSDDEPELGQNPPIASVSFGGSRRFSLRHKFRKEVERVSLELGHGSLLVMSGPTQHFWKHQVAKTAKVVEPRLNLTFRVIL
ncbi:alpha-ketoglutarate-dependent dioxygenase AlkB [soil metagenome]